MLDTIVSSDGGNPGRVHRVNIGFNAVSALSAGRVDAATAFWNAEGVALREHGIDTREFRVDAYGAPRFPELILTAAPDLYGQGGQQLRESVLRAVSQGYEDARSDPGAALDDLFDQVPELDPDETRAELDALLIRPRLLEQRLARRPTASPGALCLVAVGGRAWNRQRNRSRGARASARSRRQPTTELTSCGNSRTIRDLGTAIARPASSARRLISTSVCW